MRVPRAVGLALALAAAPLHVGLSGAQAAPGDPPYVVRGRKSEAVQRTFNERITGLHAALVDVLQQRAPDLLPRLDPPAPAVTGYQLLPRVLPDLPPPPAAKPQVVSFYWGWTDSLYARETANLDALGVALEKAVATPARSDAAARAALESLVGDYKKLADARRRIDADVGYNWLWQREISAHPERFDRATRLIDEAVALLAKDQPLTPEILTAAGDGAPPAFLRVVSPAPREHIVTLPLATDIVDEAFLTAFRNAVEGHWQMRVGQDIYRVELDLDQISPDALYCDARDRVDATPPCAPPAKGDQVDLAAHIRRFPTDRAILTTGAGTLHVAAGRAIALAPHDVRPRALAHELGHLMGFPDAYLRGYRNVGADGFRVLEFVPDPSDIMASPGAGTVQAVRFRQLTRALTRTQ